MLINKPIKNKEIKSYIENEILFTEEVKMNHQTDIFSVIDYLK